MANEFGEAGTGELSDEELWSLFSKAPPPADKPDEQKKWTQDIHDMSVKATTVRKTPEIKIGGKRTEDGFVSTGRDDLDKIAVGIRKVGGFSGNLFRNKLTEPKEYEGPKDVSEAGFEAPKAGPTQQQKVEEAERDKARQDTLNAHLAGFNPRQQDKLLDIYSRAQTDEGLAPHEAYRRFLIHRNDMVQGGPGWPEWPNEAPTDDFWSNYLGGDVNDPQAFAGGREAIRNLKTVYDVALAKGVSGVATRDSSIDADELDQLKRRLELAGVPFDQPLKPYDAFIAMREVEKIWFPDGRPEARQTFGDLVINGALGAPFGAVGVLAPFAAHATEQVLPETTPQVVKDAINFGIYGFGLKGNLAQRARFGAGISASTVAGGAAAEVAGVNPLVGQFVGPILSPGMAAIARRHVFQLNNRAVAGEIDQATLQASLKKMEVDLTPDDIGTVVIVGDQLGTVTGVPRKGLIDIELESGLKLTTQRDTILPLPGAKSFPTLRDEVRRLRLGEKAGQADDHLPVVLNEDAIRELPVQQTYLHMTPGQNVESIFKEGFRPTEAGPGTIPGVYLSNRSDPTSLQMQNFAYGQTLGRGATKVNLPEGSSQSGAVFVDIPSGPVANENQVLQVMRDTGLRESAGDMAQLATELKKRGFVGADWRDGTVFFDAASVKPTLAARGLEAWDDFMVLAKGIMNGTARVEMQKSLAGAGGPIPGLSKELNTLINAATNNVYDRRAWLLAAQVGARAKAIPATAPGRVWLFARSAFGKNPGLRKLTQPQFFASAVLDEAQQARIALKVVTIEKAVREAFGDAALAPDATPLKAHYKGAVTGSAHDYLIGTLAHAAENKAKYTLTAQQDAVLDLVQDVFNADARFTQSIGITFDMLEGAYIPLRRTDEIQSWSERLLRPHAGGGASAARPAFAKHRTNRNMEQWADMLASQGERAETDLLKLVNQRLSSSARLRADQMFLQSVAKTYGRPIGFPQTEKILREALTDVKSKLRGRMQTALRQEVRAVTQDREFTNMNRLLRATETVLDDSIDRLSGTSPITGNPFARLEGAISALDKEATRIAASTQRLNERFLRTSNQLDDTLANIRLLKAEVKKLSAMVSQQQRASAPHGWTEIGIGRLKQRMAVPEDIAREVNLIMSPQERGAILGMAEDTVQFLRSAMLSWDGSFLTKQGYDLATVDPLRFFSKAGAITAASLSHDGFMVHIAQNMDAYTRYVAAGGTLFTSATDAVKSLRPVQAQGARAELAAFIRGDFISDRAYGRAIPMLKMQQWTSMNQMLMNLQNDRAGLQMLGQHLPKPFGDALKKFGDKLAGLNGASVFDIERASADMINNIGGGINWSKFMDKPNLATGVIFLTEGWMRANVGRIVDAARIGDPRGVVARRFFFQNLALTAMLSTALSLQFSGRLPTFDPRATDFLDIQVGPDDAPGGGKVALLPGKTYIRQIFRTLGGVRGAGGAEIEGGNSIEARIESMFRFSSGRMGQLPSLGVDVVTGRDFNGMPIGNPALYVAKSLLPLAGQSSIESLQDSTPDWSIGLNAIGLNWIPNSPFSVRDEKVRQSGFVDEADPDKAPITRYSDLSDRQRAAFDLEHPEYSEQVRQWQQDRESPYAATRAIRDKHRYSVAVLGKVFRGEEITDEERALLGPEGANLEAMRRNPVLYRQMLSNLALRARQESDRVSSGESDFAANTVSQEVVSGYYSEVIDKSIVGGSLDYTLMDANERAYRRMVQDKYGDDAIRVLDEELVYRTSDDPVAAAYHKDQQLWDPYFEYLDGFWTADNLVSAGYTPEQALVAASFPNRQQYEADIQAKYIDELIGKPLPSNIHNYRTSSSGKTVGERFGIVPGKRLNEQQAQEIAEELVRIVNKNYVDRVGVASKTWLKENNEALCAMSYWAIIDPPEDVRPYLQLCEVKQFPQ